MVDSESVALLLVLGADLVLAMLTILVVWLIKVKRAHKDNNFSIPTVDSLLDFNGVNGKCI